MKLKTTIILLIVFVAIIVSFSIAFVVAEVITINRAHETFEGYCQWRGLVVVSKSSDFGYCQNVNTGKESKMVLFKGKWYLDGDLPCGFLCF